MLLKGTKIPYAVGNFEKIVEDGYFLVDKTPFIRELEKYEAPVFLRPRRFGKTLWCSILECYYDVNRRDRFEALFGQLDIGANPTPHRNSRLVLRLNFSLLDVKPEYGFLEGEFNRVCHLALREFAAANQAHLPGLQFAETSTAVASLGLLLSRAREQNAPPLLVIIDEYDNFTNQLITTRQESIYSELTTGDSFLRTFFKGLKAGLESRSIAQVFITGVLPVTIDDLTSGFNVAEIITLNRSTLSLLGFTQAEVDEYLQAVFDVHGFNRQRLPEIRAIVRQYYNGYRFLPDAAEPLYNSTIITYFLKHFALSNGEIPIDFIDENVRIDVSWIRRLCGGDADARTLMERLILDGTLPYDRAKLSSKFGMRRFFAPEFYPINFFYLGMMTFLNDFRMVFPNQTVKTIFGDYFNEIERITVSDGYADYFERFGTDLDLDALFAGYWKTYLSQFPAQMFDRANENFFRSTFYELCRRYLSHLFTFAIEVNRPSGRSDLEILGRTETRFRDLLLLVEFKHFFSEEGARLGILDLTAPRAEEVRQIDGYAADILREFPRYRVVRHVIYVVANKGYRVFRLDPIPPGPAAAR